MDRISLHDYSDNYAEAVVPVCTYYDDLSQLSGGTDSAGVEYEVSHSTDGTFKKIDIIRHDRCITASEVDDFLIDALGYSVQFQNVSLAIKNYFLSTYGPGTYANLQPYMSISYSEFERNQEPWAVSAITFVAGNTTVIGNLEARTDQGYVSTVPFAYAHNGHVYYGAITTRAYGGGGTYFLASIEYSENINETNFTQIALNPGEKGFTPTGAYTDKNIPGNGGQGTTQKKHPDYASDLIAQPGAPNENTASAIGAGFLTCYKIDHANLEAIGKNLYGDDMINIIKNIAVNPLDFIVSLMVFPCAPAAVKSAENIKLGGWLCAAAGGGIINVLGTNAVGNPLNKQFKVVDFGTVAIPENWGNFLDYSQTTIELYLPFVGSVNLDVSECMGGTVNVQYTIDFFTGMCVANVLCKKPNYVLPSGKVLTYVNSQRAYQGNCAIQIPLSRVDYGSMIGSLINACTQGITNPVAGFAGIAADAVAGGFRPNVSSKGNIVANSGFCSILYPYIRITRPITAEPQSYQEVVGLPSYINTTLGQCSDLCVCDDIDLRGINGATENELNKIRQMCKDGVYV